MSDMGKKNSSALCHPNPPQHLSGGGHVFLTRVVCIGCVPGQLLAERESTRPQTSPPPPQRCIERELVSSTHRATNHPKTTEAPLLRGLQGTWEKHTSVCSQTTRNLPVYREPS